jgi:hypothetical protein
MLFFHFRGKEGIYFAIMMKGTNEHRNIDSTICDVPSANNDDSEDYESTDYGTVIDVAHETQLELSMKHQSVGQQQQQQLSQKETQSVRRLKLGMITILTVSAIVTGVLSFWYLRRTEHLKFQSMFHDDASKLGQSMYGGVIHVFGSLDLLSTMMVTHAHSANETWPLTTLPHYGIIASKILSLSAAFNIWTTMLVNGTEQRLQWEEYAWDHRSFVNETLHIMETDPAYSGEIPWNISMKQSLHDDYNEIPYNES